MSGREVLRHIWAADDAEVDQYILREKNVGAAPLSWKEAFLRFREDRPKLSEGYIADVERAVKAVESELSSNVTDITLEQMASWLRRYRQETSGRAANKRLQELLSIARYCRSQGLIKDLPWEHAPKFQHKPERPRGAFSLDELPQYIESLSIFARLPVLMLAFTGERVSAIINLKWSDISDEEIVVTKKGGTRRPILLTAPMRDILAQAQRLHQQHAHSSEYVFFNSHRNPWTVFALDHHVRGAWRRANLPHRVLHELRHTVGTLGGKRFPGRSVQAALGHEQLATSDIYVHPDKHQAHEVLCAVGAEMLGPKLKPFLNGTPPAKVWSSGPTIVCPHCGNSFSEKAAGKKLEAGESPPSPTIGT